MQRRGHRGESKRVEVGRSDSLRLMPNGSAAGRRPTGERGTTADASPAAATPPPLLLPVLLLSLPPIYPPLASWVAG